ncbi:hypothetical protein [Isobaculum melis]|uniref:Uncharacterized protein n=1 Tax=Isobaculum melis TaxID=142588 RepID=A0A1H9S0M8_9LACT|nr:hypothetical protein [Isobaculum melis]SER78488.1 hypothetical protein SAMN04488559_10614 [Isobaculum melis]
MRKMRQYLLLSCTFLLVFSFISGCGGTKTKQADTEKNKVSNKEDFKTEKDALTYVYNKYMNSLEDHQPIRYYLEDHTMPGVLTPYSVTEFIYDQDKNAKSFQMSGEIYSIDGIVYSREIAKSLQHNLLTIISDELVETSTPTDYFIRNSAIVNELSRNILMGYLKVTHTTEIEVEGEKDDLVITLKNITFEDEAFNEKMKSGTIVLEEIVITDQENDLTLQLVTKDYTNKVVLTPNYQGKVEKPQLYQKGDTLDYDMSEMREILQNKD